MLIFIYSDTLKNVDTISAFLSTPSTKTRLSSLSFAIDDSNSTRKPLVAPIDIYSQVKCISSFLVVKTDVGRGHGVVRLCKDATDGHWKAFTLFTTLSDLKGHEEAVGHRRIDGVKHGQITGRKNWKERREAELEYEGGREPAVLIIGKFQGSAIAI